MRRFPTPALLTLLLGLPCAPLLAQPAPADEPIFELPKLTVNEPADLFRRHELAPNSNLAGIMMSGLISDTLLLQSPTSTQKDADTLNWLQAHAGIKAEDLAKLIFSSGSVILASPADKVVRSDFKIYDEEDVRFSVSQVEELGFDNFWQHAKALSAALADLRATERLAFAVLLITDINTQNSLMLVKGDPEFIRRISYAHVEQDEVFDLPGVVSRKKQLVPYLTGVLKEMTADGDTPLRLPEDDGAVPPVDPGSLWAGCPHPASKNSGGLLEI